MPILVPDEAIRGTLLVERFLGEGAFAEVFRVRDRLLHRRMAMKVFKAPVDSLDQLEEWLEEGRVLSQLEHPNIVRVYDAGLIERVEGQYGFFTMELVAGGSLADRWKGYDTQRMPVVEAVDIVRQVCCGLALAHSKSPPIIHRDVKPQNILVGIESGGGLRIRVGDFGLARAVNPLTRVASAAGTPVFKPPEIFEGCQDSPSTDVWAVGVTFYLLLTGQLAYAPTHEGALWDRQRFERPLPPASLYNISIDQELDALVARCLDRCTGPGRRFADAVELLERLGEWSPHAEVQHEETEAGSPDPLGSSLMGSAASVSPEELVAQAFQHVREGGDLETAADLLERAINRRPALAARYGRRLELWRSGAIM